MSPVYLAVAVYLQVVLLFFAVGFLREILRYLKRVDRCVFDMHIALVRKEDPKIYGGGNLHNLDY